ncbi:DUF4160 domain-containing protein [Limnothrix sp. FACHB-708]|uniref:DUF4160 domain-containing protein n=1 Tax=unclassified Limnothrix TaxID=2632864 RepID=UPI001684F2C5|nr:MULTISPECIES: DUF4160 domain-containing protein [unclassified Limnothrix]MBD2552731.1 DUF4160 domain-containing protein [Limnothrix sp. FACHB-708]MBD2590001.1 DUF4160 domain-containing protein [Limnothrix sp. FACHB-406]
MPTLLRIDGYRFFCYAGDHDEPPHIHVRTSNNEAKFWLVPVRLQSNQGFSAKELNRIQRLIETNQPDLMEKWDEFFRD